LKDLKTDPTLDFALVRPQVEMPQARARQRLANTAANEFVMAIYNGKITPARRWNRFSPAQKVTPKPLAPFTSESGPAELGGRATSPPPPLSWTRKTSTRPAAEPDRPSSCSGRDAAFA